ncbi:MAG: TldD/PmbA family protein [Proteobacteria bacterium]|nr:TldD/PmbA family protein [Pseudomonadota bacterium]
MHAEIEERFRRVAPDVDFWSLRFVDERSESIEVRQDVLEPVALSSEAGAMITIIDKGGLGYAATSDLSPTGLARAAEEACAWARHTRGRSVVDFSRFELPAPRGEYATPVTLAWSSVPLREKIDLLREQSARLKIDARIVDWSASVWNLETDTLYITSNGGAARQRLTYIVPFLEATANEGAETQTRSLGGRGFGRQGGWESLERVGFLTAAPRIGEEALELLLAPNCPSGVMDLLLAPDQMSLQIHESIGHPLELDRILGDERNYAGTSFVTLDMFGTYRYGSDLLNVTYDPTQPEHHASYGFDDDGSPAVRTFLIEKGILMRPLGGFTSQRRAGVEGVANARACSWNRPPIDRMANLNLEPGTSTFDDMVAGIESGVYMKTNNSWSIDDSRNKFQFGCEWGRRIVNGRLAEVVKTPNYRGVSSTFWRSLAMVGDDRTFEVFGTPNCGKGEPNQMVRTGHASPTCLFRNVDVFGGV